MLRTGPRHRQKQLLVLEVAKAGLVADHKKVGSMLCLRSRFEEHEFDHLHHRHSLLPMIY